VVDVPLDTRTWQPDYEALKAALAARPETGLVHFNVQNNPVGTVLERGPFDAFAAHVFANHPNTVILADESDHEFAAPQYRAKLPDFAAHIARGANLIHLQTFSHAFALTGLRIGYLFAPPPLIAKLKAKRIARPVNAFGHAAALASLADHRNQVSRSARLVDEGRRYLYAELDAMGLRYLPSQGHYVLLDTGRNGDVVWTQLIVLGVLTRYGSEWDMGSWIRVCPGQPDENRRFIGALKAVLGAPDPGNVPPPPIPVAERLDARLRRDQALSAKIGPVRRPFRVTPAGALV
jgi:histidinol-phosphate aminotransferase